MAEEPEITPENEEEELLLTEVVEPDEAPEAVDPPEEEEEEILTFGDEPTEVQETDSATIRHLREKLKEANRRLAEKPAPVQHEQPIEVGEKPTLASCDYDEERFETELDAWKGRAEAEKAREKRIAQASEDEKKGWEAELNAVNEEKAALGRADVEDAFATVREALTPAQQALIVQTADKGNRAKLIYALAHNPVQLAELAGINVTDALSVAKYAKAVTKLEGKLTVVKRRTAPNPDTPERPSAPHSNTSGATKARLDKLHKQAQETGDYTAYYEAKRKAGG